MAKGKSPPNAHSTKYSSLAWQLAKLHFPLRADKSLHVVAHAIQIGMREEAKMSQVDAPEPKISPAQHMVNQISVGKLKRMQHGLADLLCWYAGVKTIMDLMTLTRDTYTTFDTPPGVDKARDLNTFLLNLFEEDANPKETIK